MKKIEQKDSLMKLDHIISQKKHSKMLSMKSCKVSSLLS